MIDPPVMLWVMSFRPGFAFNILAGVVYKKCVSNRVELCSLFLHPPISPLEDHHNAISTHLRIFTAFEERSHEDKADIVVPHDNVLGVLYLEDILEDCHRVNTRSLTCSLASPKTKD